MRFLTAHKLFSGQDFLPEASVLVLDEQNRLRDIVLETVLEKNEIERYDGIITPGFVNAHCHLELSHLKNRIPRGTGLPGFAMQVVAQRNKFSKEEIGEHINQADSVMWNNGIVAVGDISNTEDSFAKKANSKIYYHTFVELIGLKPEAGPLIFEKGLELLQKLKSAELPGSLAPHAPYSTSRELIKQIADYNVNNQSSFSIHNQESKEEAKFFKGEPGGFDDLYKTLNLDLSWFIPPKTSSLKYYISALSQGPSILVHNTFTNAEDLSLTQDKSVFWCFCPGANKHIENTLPDFELFKQFSNRVCIGTDSLASNSQLDVLQEADLILASGDTFTPGQLLQAITYNGALALGLPERYGSFIMGKNTGLNLVRLNTSNINFIKKIS